ncbi:MAG: PilZ domain-containing protein [Desulfobacterales bacterium]
MIKKRQHGPFPDIGERRRSYRVPYGLFGQVWIEGMTVSCRMIDISPEGCLSEVDQDVAVGSCLRFGFRLRHSRVCVCLPCKVVRKGDDGVGLAFL